MCGPSFRSIPVSSSDFSQVSQLNSANSVQSNESQRIDDSLHLNEVSSQLTQLLNRVSKRSTVGVNLQDVQLMVGKNKQLKKSQAFRDLFKTATTVQQNLQHLDVMKGTQIASAYNPNTNTWTGPVGETIEAVNTALATLSDQLLQLVNDPRVMADNELHELLTEKYLKNCCRESEFHTVLMSIVDIKGDNGQPLTEEAKQTLSRSVHEWMVELAPTMHGTNADINLASNPAMQNLQTLLEELKGTDEANISNDKRQQIFAAVQAAQAHIHTVATAETTIDKDFFRAADEVFKNILSAISNPKQAALKSIIDRHLSACVNLPSCLNFSDGLLKELSSSKGKCPRLVKFINLRRTVAHHAKAYIAACQTPNIKKKELDALRQNVQKANEKMHKFLSKENSKIVDGVEVDLLEREVTNLANLVKYKNNPSSISSQAFADLPNISEAALPEILKQAEEGSFLKAIEEAHKDCRSLNLHIASLRTIINRTNTLGDDVANTKQLLSTIFTKELPISTILECRANGIEDRDIDVSLCDENIHSTKAFGEGGVNTVYEVTMKDGRTFIFKPENSGRTGAAVLNLAKGAYDNDINITALNIAAHDAANALGLGDLIVDAKIGICNGRLGVFMEKAPGTEVDKAVYSIDEDGDEINKDPFENLDDATFLKTNGQLMQKTYNLEWADYIIGSGDRHCKNYFVDLNANGNVAIKGIDNDMTFAKYRTSFSEVTITKDRCKSFLLSCHDHIERYTRESLSNKTLVSYLNQIPGISIDLKNEIAKVDLAKIQQPWLRKAVADVFGMHQLVPPRFIDQGLYNRLMELDNEAAQDDYRNRLKGRMNEKNVEAAMSRLISAIQYAKDLHAKGRVISDWENARTQHQIFSIHEAETRNTPNTVFEEDQFNFNKHVVLRPRMTNNLYFRDFKDAAMEHLGRIPY
ncbi:MAG: hypothetical protein Q4F99_06600 [bacterium]|nr:hypothetical protein [bacterium]